jgi:ankyrin repeat protein
VKFLCNVSNFASSWTDILLIRFRWVELQLRHFCDLKLSHSIEQAMLDPAGASIHTLNHLYATIFDRIVKTDPLAYNVAAQIFRLMMCLHEVMPPTALLAAASITRDRVQYSLELSDLLRTCSCLVVLDDELDTLRFAHVSVQEYLARLPEFSITNANNAAASSCLIRCIDNPLPDLTIGIQPARGFDLYAAMYWPLHYNAASEHDRNGYLRDVLKEFMFSNEDFMSPFPLWIETIDEISKTLSGPHARLMDLAAIGSESATPLFTACIYGLEFAIEVLSEMSAFDVNQKNRRGHTGLYLASAAGQTRVVDRLLKLGADVGIEGGRHMTALQAACANGHGDIAQLILDFSSQTLTAGTITSAVQAALRNDREHVALILLKRSPLPMSQDTFDPVFEAAAGMGFTELLNYLHSTSNSLSDKTKLIPSGAERTFHDSKVDLFPKYFQNRALPNDAIATAAFYGQNKIIEFCIDKGLDIEHEGPFGTPLRAASLMGHGTTVRLLLDKDVEINANGSFGDALQAAAMRGHLSITTILIQSGVAVDNSGGYYGNALQAATYRGHIDVVKALLAAGAPIGQNGLFSDAMTAAVSAGNQPIADLLLRSGYQSLHFFDEDEIMRMSSAYMRDPHPSHLDLLSALDTTHQYERTRQADRANAIQERDLSFQEAYKSIQTGAEVENVTELPNLEHTKRYNSHALLVATTTGQESVVRTMLDARFVIGLSLLDIGIVLKVASAAGRHGIVDYILSIPDLPRDYIPRALERAAWYGHVAIIKRLLKCQEAYGPPPSSRYAPFTPDSHWVRLTPRRDNGFGRVPDGDKKIRWLNYFPLPYEVVETNETAENGHIARILLQGCRANAPATVEFALELAAEYGLQNLPAVALATTIRSNSGQALEVLLRHYPAVDAIVLEKACAQAEQDEALSALYVLLNHHIDHGYQLQDYWRVFDGAATAKHSRFISHLTTQTLHCREDSLLEKRFIEAAQRGYVSAMEAWEGRLCESPHHKLALSQALDRACANGHAAVVSYLIERGVDVNTIVEEPVQPSSLADHHSVSLHSDGVTKNEVWPRTALQACLQATPQCDRIRGIWNNEFDKFKDKKRAFLSKQQAVIQLLLRKDANVNIVDSHGRNALHYAALYCPVTTVQMILASGASISLLDKDNKTPLVYAAWRELDSLTVLEALTTAERQVIKPSEPRTSSVLLLDAALSVFNYGFIESESVHQVLTTGPGAVIKYLLQSQFDLQATGTGFTLLLQMASADGDIDLVRLLIERNVDLKAVAHYYGTALHTAAWFGHLDCVKLLVEAGAEIALTAGKFTWTPLRAAVQGHHLAIVQCLLDWGVMRSFDYSMDLSSAGVNDRCSTLTFACRSGNIDLVQLLLSYSEQSILMPSQPKEQRTQFADMSSALQGACSHGHAEIAALLIEYGADVEEKSGNSQSLLTTAASTGSLETLKVLLAAGATLFNAERAVNVLRTLVVKEKPKDVIDYVLAHLLDTDDFINACKEVPAHMRAWQEDAKFVLHVDTMRSSERLLAGLAALGAQRSIELLLEKSFDMADVRLPVLQAAAYFQSYDVLFKLLPMVVIPPPIPSGYQSPVYALLEGLMPIKEVENFHKSLCCEAWAADSFQYRVFGQEDKKCACDNARNAASEAIMKLAQIDESHIRKPVGILHLSSYLGMLKVVQVCLELGVEINQHHDSFGSALIAAIEGSSSEVVTLLLQRQIDVNTASSELGAPLYLACTTRNTGWRCLVDHTTPTAGTALSRACQSRDREMAEVLLQHGAKVNVLIPGKGTPMHVACEERDKEMLRLLLKYGADVDIISPDLGAALHVACKSQDSGLVKILLQHGAKVNVFSPDHGTPLHAACTGNECDAIIQLLLKHGADVNSKGSMGETPFTSILQHDRHVSLIEALLRTEQQLDVTENDLDMLVTGYMSSTSGNQICKRVLADNTHLQPTIKTIRLVLAGHGDRGSDILRLLLARAPYLEITLELVRKANDFESFELLTQHGSCIKITAEVMKTFLDPLELDMIKYSVQSAPDVKPPRAVVKALRAILDEPEPKPMAKGSLQDKLWISLLQHRQSFEKPFAKEIMELILARHPNAEGLRELMKKRIRSVLE